MDKVWKGNSTEGHRKKNLPGCACSSLDRASRLMLCFGPFCIPSKRETAPLGNWNRKNKYKTCLLKHIFSVNCIKFIQSLKRKKLPFVLQVAWSKHKPIDSSSTKKWKRVMVPHCQYCTVYIRRKALLKQWPILLLNPSPCFWPNSTVFKHFKVQRISHSHSRWFFWSLVFLKAFFQLSSTNPVPHYYFSFKHKTSLGDQFWSSSRRGRAMREVSYKQGSWCHQPALGKCTF